MAKFNKMSVLLAASAGVMLLRSTLFVAPQAMPIVGRTGKTMTAAEVQKAKQAHRRDPVNNLDPRQVLDLGRNVGYDVVNGVRREERPRQSRCTMHMPSFNSDSGPLDKVIGYLEDGTPVTLRELKVAEAFHKANPTEPKPEVLALQGTSFSSSLRGTGSPVKTTFSFQRRSVRTRSLSSMARTSMGKTQEIMCMKPEDSAQEVLPKFEDATEQFNAVHEAKRDHFFSQIWAVVNTYGLEGVVAVDLKHKHFDLPRGHVLCEEVHSDKSVMKATTAASPMIPFAFKLEHDIFLPHEFVEAACTPAREGLAKVLDNPGFLEEFAHVLKTHNMQEMLGLHIQHRDHLVGKHGTIETPGDNELELMIQPYTKELHEQFHGADTTFKVMWNQCRGGSCTFCWCSHCSHCGTHCNSH